MQQALANSCNCRNCAGTACTCGCQAPAAAKGCACGPQCQCGSQCACEQPQTTG